MKEVPNPIVGHRFKYHWEAGYWHSDYWGTKPQKDKEEFMEKAAGVAKDLQVDADDLMAVIAFESWFGPSIGNAAGGTAVGLIQFMPTSAMELNTTSADLVKMSGLEQLDYVYGYLLKKGGRGNMKTLGDVYMAILWPPAIGAEDDYVLWESGSVQYKQNSGLDLNKDGKITKADATQAVINRRNEYGLR